MAFKDPDARRAYDAAWKRKKRAEDPEKENARRRAQYKANPEPVLARNAEWRAKNREHLAEAERQRKKAKGPEANRAYRLRRCYGLSIERYEEMVTEQAGVCAICGREESPLSVDHCHLSGMVRGLLCKNCNKGLGMFGETAATVRLALEYLERHQRSKAS